MSLCYSFIGGSVLETIYDAFLASLYSIIPSCIISVLNILIIKKMKSQHRFRNNHQKSKDTQMKILTMTMLAVCIVFIITTLPAEVFLIMRLISELLGIDLITSDSVILRISYQLGNINHSVNFLLYCLTGSVFRQTLVNLCQCCRRQNPQGHIEEPCPTVEAQV